jgi:starvation-inducible outer membrane lipoprotein
MEGALFMGSRFRSSAGYVYNVRPRCLSLIAGVVSCGLVACGGPIPSQYLKQVEPGVTLTALSKRNAEYQGKVVILGGVIVGHKAGDNRVWLHVKNRPLDGDYIPHIPITNEGSEAGHYWVMVWNKDLPRDYQQWARITVVGRLMGGKLAFDEEGSDEKIKNVVLSAIFLKGWDRRLGGYGVSEEDSSGIVRAPAPPKPLQKNSMP